MNYHVRYWYCATGMEGIPHIINYGLVDALSEREAKWIVGMREYPRVKDELSREFFMGCLDASTEPFEVEEYETSIYTKEEWEKVIESRKGFWQKFRDKINSLLTNNM